jgi:Domain of unknown function (DUF3291)
MRARLAADAAQLLLCTRPRLSHTIGSARKHAPMQATGRHHLAQINVARMLYPLDHPEMAGFVAQLDRINALADRAPGFVWRLQDDSGNATGLRPFDDPMMIVNMSVWRSPEALFAFVYRSAHVEVMRARKAWFEQPAGAYMALWWLPAGAIPSVAEGKARLEHLQAHGPSAHAFTLKQRFLPPAEAA